MQKKTTIKRRIVVATCLILYVLIWRPWKNESVKTDGAVKNGAPSILDEAAKSSAPTIPVARVVYDFRQNELRAIDSYKGKAFNLVGVFSGVRDANGEIVVTLSEDWSSPSYIYAQFASNVNEQVRQFNRGDLVTVTCTELDKYGLSPKFHRCAYIEKTDTKEKKADLFLDELIYQNNELLKKR